MGLIQSTVYVAPCTCILPDLLSNIGYKWNGNFKRDSGVDETSSKKIFGVISDSSSKSCSSLKECP